MQKEKENKESKPADLEWPLGTVSDIIRMVADYIPPENQLDFADLSQENFNACHSHLRSFFQPPQLFFSGFFTVLLTPLGQLFITGRAYLNMKAPSGTDHPWIKLTVPGVEEPIIKVAMGSSLWLLTASGRLFEYGLNVKNPTWFEEKITGLAEPICDLSSQGEEILVLTLSGRLFGKGRNLECQLGLGHDTQIDFFTEIKIEGLDEPIVAVITSSYKTFIQTASGRVYACGVMNIEHGQLGIGDSKPHTSFAEVTTAGLREGIFQIYPTRIATLFYSANRRVFACGWNNEYITLGFSKSQPSTSLTQVKITDFPALERIVKVTTDYGETIFVLMDSGRLFVCGRNMLGELGLGHNERVHCFTEVKITGLAEPIVDVVTSMSYTFVLTASHQLYATGGNHMGELGLDDHKPHRAFTKVTIEGLGLNEHILQVVSCESNQGISFLWTDSGRLFACGDNTTGLLGLSERKLYPIFTEIQNPPWPRPIPYSDPVLNKRLPGLLKTALERPRDNGILNLNGLSIGLMDLKLLPTALFVPLRQCTDIVELKLENNNLNTWDKTVWQNFLEALPPSLKRLTLSQSTPSTKLFTDRGITVVFDEKVTPLQAGFTQKTISKADAKPTKAFDPVIKISQLSKKLKDAIMEVKQCVGMPELVTEMQTRYRQRALPCAQELLQYYAELDEKTSSTPLPQLASGLFKQAPAQETVLLTSFQDALENPCTEKLQMLEQTHQQLPAHLKPNVLPFLQLLDLGTRCHPPAALNTLES